MAERKVVVSGMGLISPVGNDVESSWQAVKAGKSGVAHITRWQKEDLTVQIGGEVKGFDPDAAFGRREARRSDPITQYAWAATREAMQDAGLEITDENRTRIGAIIGTGLGGLDTLITGLQNFEQRGQKGVSPIMVPMMLPDNPSGKMSIEYGFLGPNMNVASACSTGNNAIGEATSWIKRGICDVVLTGATEAGIIKLAMAGFANMTAISSRNDEPHRASRPFDRDRDGFVMSEGAGILILEDEAHAKARGARIYAEILGYGLSSDAVHITAPDEHGTGAARAMDMALRDADLTINDVDYINAHGTSTPLNDRMETRAIKSVFGEQAYDIPVSSTKSMTGHLMGAGAAIEAVFSIKAMQEGFVPPTINLDNPEDELDLDYVAHTGRQKKLDVVMSNSFGFGGHNVVVVFGNRN